FTNAPDPCLPAKKVALVRDLEAALDTFKRSNDAAREYYQHWLVFSTTQNDIRKKQRTELASQLSSIEAARRVAETDLNELDRQRRDLANARTADGGADESLKDVVKRLDDSINKRTEDIAKITERLNGLKEAAIELDGQVELTSKQTEMIREQLLGAVSIERTTWESHYVLRRVRLLGRCLPQPVKLPTVAPPSLGPPD